MVFVTGDTHGEVSRFDTMVSEYGLIGLTALGTAQIEKAVLPLVDMAVHAAVACVLPACQGRGAEVAHAALLDLHLVPDLVSGLDQAVGQIFVYGVGADLDFPAAEHAAADFD